MAYLDKHSTLATVMASAVSSNPTGGNFLKFFKPLDVNFGLKCKCDGIDFFTIRSHLHFKPKFTSRGLKNFFVDASIDFRDLESRITQLRSIDHE